MFFDKHKDETISPELIKVLYLIFGGDNANL